MSEQTGTTYKGSSTYQELFKSSLGPKDVIACVVRGAQIQTIPLGAAMIDDAANPGMKKRYTNAGGVADEALAGDGSTVAFDLANDNVVASTLRIHDSSGNQLSAVLSAGAGTGGVDQVTFEVAPSATVYVNYSTDTYLGGACVIMKAVTTTSTSGNETTDAARDGSVDSTLVLDSAGNAVDAQFKAVLPKMMFD